MTDRDLNVENRGRAAGRLARAVADMPRRAPGLLLLVPVVALTCGSYWLLPSTVRPIAVRLGQRAHQQWVSRDVNLPKRAEGALADDGLWVEPGAALDLVLPRPVRRLALAVQVRGDDRCAVQGVTDAGRVLPLSDIRPLRAAADQWATRRIEPALPEPITRVRLRADHRHRRFAVSDVRIRRLTRMRHTWVAAIVWLVALGARLFGSRPRGLRLWTGLTHADPVLALVLIALMLFKPDSLAVALAVLWAALGLLLWLVRRAAQRLPWPILLFNAGCIALAVWAAPHLLESYATYRILSEFQLDVDHRMKPDGREVNLDGIRFKGSPLDLRADDFNIIFLGDSFTYGMKLPYDASVPYALERLAAQRHCAPPVRAVNFGWVSSSPLLSYRLLMDIGRKYQPDLVVLLLDMTDFHDDLKYAHKINAREGVKLSSSLLLDNTLDRWLLRWMPMSTLRQLKEQFRQAHHARQTHGETILSLEMRYFPTNIPLAESRPYFEQGVMANLKALAVYCRQHLGVPFAVVLVPRAYQYSEREVPRDYEAHLYTIRGEHTRNPNRYFAEVKDRLPYPFLDLLPTFEAAGTFPLFFEDDPHWNADGAQLAAGAIFEFLVRESLLPCPGE
ncbi:MAG: hypothetical protein K9N49_04215 [Candidatus Marinimicrobia bacterium]|nr:hypothetical protein [Candidatus Neomarinimicrobiota bacterium]